MHLTPVMMVRSLKAENYDEAIKFGLMDCIECGSCSYVCPANVRLVQRFRLGKSIVKDQMAEAKAKAAAEKAASEKEVAGGAEASGGKNK